MILNTKKYIRLKAILIVIFLFPFSRYTNAQNWDTDIICTDTLITYGNVGVQECQRKTAFSYRVDVGRSQFEYESETTHWIGNHGGVYFGLYGAINQFVFGARFKGTTLTPKNELSFGEEIMTEEVKLNHFKSELYFGYSLDLKYNFSIEPNFGISSMSFNVINEDEINQEFDISNNYGVFAGVTLNKYFRIKKNTFFTIFFSGTYGHNDYSRVHPELNGGYLDWTVGIAIKQSFQRKFEKTINLN